MTLTETIRHRRSVRKYKTEPVPEPMIRTMVEAATYAPSASNRQPWRFMVLRDADTRRRLAACVREAVSAMVAEVPSGFEQDYASYCRHFVHFEQAPVLIFALRRSEATLAARLREHSALRERITAQELEGAVISVAMAVENLILSATDQGLATCVMTGPLVAEAAFERILAVPDGWKILCMVSVGYPDESPGRVRRKTPEQVIIHPKTGDA